MDSFLTTATFLTKLPFLLHLLIETPAAYTFLFKPACQLPFLSYPSPPSSSAFSYSPKEAGTQQQRQRDEIAERKRQQENLEATLILNSYGGLLLSTNLLCLFVLLPWFFSGWGVGLVDASAQRMLAFALAATHVGPVRRAWVRVMTSRRARERGGREKVVFGGPAVHFVVHLVCGTALLAGALCG